MAGKKFDERKGCRVDNLARNGRGRAEAAVVVVGLRMREGSVDGGGADTLAKPHGDNRGWLDPQWEIRR